MASKPRHLSLRLMCIALLPMLLTLGGPPARGQAPRPVSLADPGDAATPVPALQHRSAFVGYRPLGSVVLGDWRSANDTVTRIGGWRAYTREAHAPAAPAAATAASASAAARSASAAAPGRHHGAHGHGGH